MINDLYLESFEMLDKYKDKLLNIQLRETRSSWFKGEEITDNDESKKIGVRYLSPKHTYDPYKKG